MCRYSIEGYASRNAREGETVYSVTNHYGAFSEKPGQRVGHGMVCIAYGQVCTLENIQMAEHHATPYEQRDMARIDRRRAKVTLQRSNNGDVWEFSDGITIRTILVTSPIYVGVKPLPTDKGIAVVETAIDEALKTNVPVTNKVEA